MVNNDEYRQAMNRIVERLRADGHVPSEVAETVNRVAAGWVEGVPSPEELASAKATLWAYLKEKNGNSWTIADVHDRTVRAALCLAEPVHNLPPEQIEDLELFAADMLGRDSA